MPLRYHKTALSVHHVAKNHPIMTQSIANLLYPPYVSPWMTRWADGHM